MIKFLIELFFKKEIEERKKIRIHNAKQLQCLLDIEHRIRDDYNQVNNTVFTTAKALDHAYAEGFDDYNRHSAIAWSDFK